MAEAGDLRSVPGGSPACTHSFRNDRSSAVAIYWLDYEGRAVQYGTLDAGKALQQATYTGHAWRLVDEASGAALVEYLGASAAITLQADGSVKVIVQAADPAAAAALEQPAPAAATAAADAAAVAAGEAAASPAEG